MARYADADGVPRRRGILADQIAATEAFLAAYQVRGRDDDLRRAVDVMRFVRTNLTHPVGYLHDRVDDPEAVGMLRRQRIPLDLNARAALAAMRLDTLLPEGGFMAAAEGILGPLEAAISRLDGLTDASYGEALLAYAQPGARVELEGPVSHDLRRAALLLPVAGLAVSRTAPAAGEDGAARLCFASRCGERVRRPAQLLASLEAMVSTSGSGNGEEASANPAPPVEEEHP